MEYHKWTWDQVCEMPSDRRRRYIFFLDDIINKRNAADEKAIEMANSMRQKTPAKPPIQ